MIVESDDLTGGEPLDFDVCIIGAGAAGISLALELAETSRRICLLESGGFSHEPQVQALLKGVSPSPPYPELHETRLAALGGSTALWAGWCRPLDAIDLEQREWIADSGWPFDLTELKPHYHTAHRLCGLGPFDYDADAWESITGLKRLPVPDKDFSSTLFHVSPVNFGHRYRAQLQDSSNIQTLLHATALRLFAAGGGNQVESARIATRAGRQLDVRARQFVLASGGIENPRLMLLSGDSPERSIGNGRGLVGRFFMEHGFVNAGSFIPATPAPSLAFHFPKTVMREGQSSTVRAGFSPHPARAQDERLLNSAVFFHPAYESHPAFDSIEVRSLLEAWEKLRGRAVPGSVLKRIARSMVRPDRLAIAILRKLGAHGPIQQRWRTRALFECAPLADNRVALTAERDALNRPSVQVRWHISEQDLRSIQRVHELLDQSLRRAGLGRFESRLHSDEAWRGAIEGGKHHMGTTRMHTDPARGVVDADCKVHGVSNLYVAGSSVFPTGGFANPTLTIVALAARLAAHIKHRLDA